MTKQTAAKSSIAETVMHDIQAGKVTMRPRIYFSLLTVLAVATTVAAGLAAAYLTSIVYFWLRIVTADTMAYGARSRLSEALVSFPWWLLFFAGVLGAAAIILVRRQGHMYRHRSSALVFVLVLASLLLGLVFSTFNIGMPYAEQHNQMNQQGNGHRFQKSLK